MPHKRNRFWGGLKPVKMSLQEFQIQPESDQIDGIFAHDLEEKLLNQKNHANEIKASFKSLADKALENDNQKKLAELSVVAAELKQQRDNAIVAKKIVEQKPRFFTKEGHSANLVIRNLQRQLETEKEGATKERLVRELAIAKKSLASKASEPSIFKKSLTAATAQSTKEETNETWVKL